MGTNTNRADINHQDHPHQEGQQNNIPARQGGQRQTDNNSHELSSMMNESPEQKAGADHDQKGEGPVQQEERQP